MGKLDTSTVSINLFHQLVKRKFHFQWVLIIIALLLGSNILDAKNNKTPKFTFNGNLAMAPYFYEYNTKSHCNNFNGSLFFGVYLNKHSIGVELQNSFSLVNTWFNTLSTGQNTKPSTVTEIYIGGVNIARLLYQGYFRPIWWFNLKYALGGAWYTSSYEFNDKSVITSHKSGGSLQIECKFWPNTKYIAIDIINRFDLFINVYPAQAITENNGITPYYYGAVRLNFHPTDHWYFFNVEAGFMPWMYHSKPINFQSGVFIWSIGMSVDVLQKKEDFIKKEKKENASIWTKMNTKYVDEVSKSKNAVRADLAKLKNAVRGDVIAFSENIFPPNSSVPTSEAKYLFSEIATILKIRDGLVINIIGNANNTGHPIQEKNLSSERAKRIMNYLIKKGIKKSRMNIIANGSDFTIVDRISVLNRRIEFQIISTK